MNKQKITLILTTLVLILSLVQQCCGLIPPPGPIEKYDLKHNYTIEITPFSVNSDGSLACSDCAPISVPVESMESDEGTRVMIVKDGLKVNRKCPIPFDSITLKGRSSDLMMGNPTESYSEVSLHLNNGETLSGTYACHIASNAIGGMTSESWLSLYTSPIDTELMNSEHREVKLCPMVNQASECNRNEMVIRILHHLYWSLKQ